MGERKIMSERELRHTVTCDGFGHNGECSICSGFLKRDDGTLIHDDGSVFAPVEAVRQIFYRLKVPLSPVEPVEVNNND